MTTIKKDILHPENEPDTNIYPKTSIDQVENLQANLDAINGDISNVNGEIAALSTNVSDITTRVSTSERNITDLQNDVNQNIIDISDIKSDITTLNTAYDYFTDYTIVNNVLKLQYRSGYKFELPLKAGTNVTFSKYPGSNYLIINSTGGSVPDNIALLDANNNWSAVNKFYEYIQCNRGIKIYSNETNEGIVIDSYTITINGSIPTREDLKIEYVYQKGYALNTITKNGGSSTYNRLIIPIKNSTIATIDDIPVIPDLGNFTFSNNNMNINGSTAISRSTGSPTEFIFGNYDNTFRSASSGLFTFYNQNAYAVINLAGKTGPQTIAFKSDIPISLMYSSSRLGENSVDFPFNIDKNYFFTITMTNTGESKSFIYAKGTSSTYTIVINSSTSFEVKLDATGSSTRLIFTTKSNMDPFVVRAEISN